VLSGCWNLIGGDLRPESADFYVDPSGASGAFPTIRAALAAAEASSLPNRTIHLAAGTYEAATGETFPLELRGISLVGAGADRTILRGSGTAGIARPDVSNEAEVVAALVVGEVGKRPTTISDLSILSTGSPGAAGTEAIVCDRGDTSNLEPVPPNLIVSGVAIEGFEIGVRITSSLQALSGCNALVRASSFQSGSYGVFADGSIGDETSRFVSVQLGDGTSSGGNSFRLLQAEAERGVLSFFAGAGLATRRAVTRVTVQGNQFSDSDQGIFAYESAASGAAAGFVIVDNDFGALRNAGVQLFGYPIVDRLENNRFHDISTPDGREDITFLGVGMVIDSYNTDGFPQVRHARGNSFVENDQGLIFRSNRALRAGELQSNFGTMSDPGQNTFRCNGVGIRLIPRSVVGGDVFVAIDALQRSNIPFEGNGWDHAPPAVSPPLATFDGIDIYTAGTSIDVAGAIGGAMSPCPDDRPAGPPP